MPHPKAFNLGLNTACMGGIEMDLTTIERLIARCKDGAIGDQGDILSSAAPLGDFPQDVLSYVAKDSYVDAAIALLPVNAVWRKYTDHSASVYGASPYNAQAQERFDGYSSSKIDALMICAAFLQMCAAPLRKAAMLSARKEN